MSVFEKRVRAAFEGNKEEESKMNPRLPHSIPAQKESNDEVMIEGRMVSKKRAKEMIKG